MTRPAGCLSRQHLRDVSPERLAVLRQRNTATGRQEIREMVTLAPQISSGPAFTKLDL